MNIIGVSLGLSNSKLPENVYNASITDKKKHTKKLFFYDRNKRFFTVSI